MDQLPATTGTRTSLALTPALENALSFIDEEAVRLIASDQEMLNDATRLLPALTERVHQGATRAEIKNVIFARFPLYPQPFRHDWQWDLWWADYYSALEGLTGEAIDAGLTKWVALPDSEFLPKPGKLKALAASTATRSGRTLYIVNRAIGMAAEAVQRDRRASPAAPRLKHVPKPPEDRSAVRGMMDEFRAGQKFRADHRERHEVRPMHGPLADGHHVTAEMLALMKRQAEDNEVNRARYADL